MQSEIGEAFKAAKKNNLLKNNCVEKVDVPKLRKNEPKIMAKHEQRKLESLFANKYDFTV